MSFTLMKLKGNFWEFLKLFFQKIFIVPLKYGRKNDYDAHNYWRDRFSKYPQNSLRGVRMEGLSEKENLQAKERALQDFAQICQEEKIDFDKAHILEIGCGTGSYTEYLFSQGVKHYTGVDITDVYFPYLKDAFPQYTFVRQDVSVDALEGSYDFIIMMDVVQHIVNADKLQFTVNNIKAQLAKDGIFILVPVYPLRKRHLCHVQYWAIEDVQQNFGVDFTVKRLTWGPSQFQESLMIIKRNNS